MKLLLTLVVTVVLLLQMKTITHLADIATAMALRRGVLFEARISLVAHSGGGLLVLLLPTILSTYKPRGRTRYRLRKPQEHGGRHRCVTSQLFVTPEKAGAHRRELGA